jgi:hypothetical protein
MTPAPKRRWFQWSLRTLFVVVTVCGCWLGYELNWIQQRERFIAEQRSRIVEKSPDRVEPWWEADRASGVPGFLGDRRYYFVYVFVGDSEHLTANDLSQIERATSLFPEAGIGTIFWAGNGVFLYREGSEMFRTGPLPGDA